MEKKKVDQVYYRQFIRTAIMLLCKAICDVLGEKVGSQWGYIIVEVVYPFFAFDK